MDRADFWLPFGHRQITIKIFFNYLMATYIFFDRLIVIEIFLGCLMATDFPRGFEGI
jgi:hypothetical protein